MHRPRACSYNVLSLRQDGRWYGIAQELRSCTVVGLQGSSRQISRLQIATRWRCIRQTDGVRIAA
eukprot:8602827-Pyramimonas_sp.AAC.1